MSSSVVWVLEAEVFPHSHASIREAVERAGHEVVLWSDEWWITKRWPRLTDRVVVFHGSLGNASRIVQELPWRPGAYCDTKAFHCSSWYPQARPWLLHRDWRLLGVSALVNDADVALQPFGSAEAIFVRPDSPLKPFSGRVVPRAALSLKALDHGFYYDDVDLAVVVAPVRAVEREWRYVVVDGQIVAGSRYVGEHDASTPDVPESLAWQFAAQVASALSAPEPVYVLDVCEADGDLRLLELNPFSGADLYHCDPAAVVAAVTACARAR